MALTSTLQADFGPFVVETDKAAQGLVTLQVQADKTEAAISDMGTKAETSMRATGTAAAGLGEKAKQTSSGFTDMSKGLGVADRTLNAFGVNIGQQIGALSELGQISGKTAEQIGKVGVATSVAAAAFAGWGIGRKIAELTGADEAIGNLTASLLGWRDAGQAAANNAEVLQRAFEKTGQRFTDVHLASEALRKSSRESAAQIATTSNMVVVWEKEIAHATGGAAALRGEIEAGNLTMAQMRERFHLSAEAIDYLKRNMALAKEETEKLARAEEKAAAAAKAHADARQKLRESMLGTDVITQANAMVDAIGGLDDVLTMSTAKQAELNTVLGAAIETYGRVGGTASGALNEIYIATLPLPPQVESLEAAWNSVGTAVTVNIDSAIAKMREMTEADRAFEAETRRLVDEWNKVTPPIDAAKDEIRETTAAQQQLTVAMRDFGTTAMTAYESAIAGAQLLQAYADAGVATSHAISMGGYEFDQLKKTGVPGGWSGVQWADRTPTPTQPWGNTLNVNVNSTDAQAIAEKLTTEMRHQGVRF